MNLNDPIIMEPPHSIEAEQSVIGALLMDNDAVDRVGDLRVDHFYRQDHRDIFSEIRRQIASGKACDVISVYDELRAKHQDLLVYLNSIIHNTPSAANISRYAEMVRDRALRRGLIAATNGMADMAFNPAGKSAAEILDFAQNQINQLAETRVKREPVRASDAMIQHVDVIEARCEGKVFGISTGLKDLDALLNGGMNRGDLIIVGARPSMGKTSFALNVGAHVAKDHGVLVCSQEMSNGQLLDRTLSFLGKVPLSHILTGQMEDDDWTGFTAGTAKLRDMNLALDEQPSLSILDVRSKARLVKRKYGLDFLVVDYLQLMVGDGPNRNSQLEEISRGLKSLAKELNIVVMALSQLSRNGANTARPKLTDLRDSGAIEQDADVVMFIYRDEVDNPSTHLRGIADVFVAKNRQGRIDELMLAYEGMYTLFTDFHGHRPASQVKEHRRGLAREL